MNIDMNMNRFSTFDPFGEHQQKIDQLETEVKYYKQKVLYFEGLKTSEEERVDKGEEEKGEAILFTPHRSSGRKRSCHKKQRHRYHDRK